MNFKNEKFNTPNKNDSIRVLLQERLYNSLAQAFLNFFKSQYLTIKILLFVFILSLTCLASFLVIQTIVTYLNYEVLTISRTIYETPTLFPKVTFCNVNQFTTEYAYNQTQKQQVFNGDILQDDEKKKFGHDLKDILIECYFNQNACDSTDFIWSFDYYYGNCYTFNTGFDSNGNKIDLKKSNLAGPDFGLQLTLYTNFYEELLSFANGFGAIIRIGNSSYSMYDSNNGLFASAGFNNFISINREFKSMLPKPYSNCEIDENSASFLSNWDFYNLIGRSTYAYTQQLCFSQCLQRKVINKFNCTFPYIISLYNDVKTCTRNLYQVILSDLKQSLENNFIDLVCLPLCPLECNQTLWKSSMSSYQLVGSQYISKIKANIKLSSDFINRTIDAQTAEKSIVYINIFYDRLSYSLNTESPQMSNVNLVASIGGNLSLFLGVSVFSLCELIEVFIEIVFVLNKKTF